jgi:hypothetical protein
VFPHPALIKYTAAYVARKSSHYSSLCLRRRNEGAVSLSSSLPSPTTPSSPSFTLYTCIFYVRIYIRTCSVCERHNSWLNFSARAHSAPTTHRHLLLQLGEGLERLQPLSGQVAHRDCHQKFGQDVNHLEKIALCCINLDWKSDHAILKRANSSVINRFLLASKGFSSFSRVNLRGRIWITRILSN